MTRIWHRSTVALLSAIAITLSVQVQADVIEPPVLADESVCVATLTPDITILKSRDDVRLAWLNIIDVQRFQQEKRNVETGASVIVYGIPISGYGNYEQFSEARSREFEERRFNYSRQQSIDFLQSKISGAGYDAFIRCLEIESRKAPGLHLWAKRIADDSVDVAMLWNVPGRAVSLNTSNVQFVGTTAPAGFLPRRLESSANFEQRFTRKPNEEFYVAINVDGYSDSVRIPKPIVLAPAGPPKVCHPPASESDLGYPETRLQRDINADGCEDFCRVIGEGTGFKLQCSLGFRGDAGVKPSVTTVLGDGGYPSTRHWIDYNTDGKLDFCRVIGNGPGDYSMLCASLDASGSLGSPATIWSKGRDFGYSSRWIDINVDGIPDWCRQVGGKPSVERCLLNNRKQLGEEVPGR